MNESRLAILLDSLTPGTADVFLLYAIALEYRSMNKPELSLDYFRQVIAADEKYLATYYQLASLYISLDMKSEASQTYLRGIELAGLAGNSHTLNELKQAYRQFTDEDE